MNRALLSREMLTNPENVPVFDFFHGTNCFYSLFFFSSLGESKNFKNIKTKEKRKMYKLPLSNFCRSRKFLRRPNE